MNVINKHGNIVSWSNNKICNAVNKASERVGENFSQHELQLICTVIKNKISGDIHVNNLHNIVEQSLRELEFKDVAEAYSAYRNYKTNFVSLLGDLYDKAHTAITHGDRENANFESSLISTKQALIRGYLTKELYKLHYLTKEERVAIEDGYIYIHDLRDLIFNGFNCCLFDIGTVLEGGFEMANLKYKEPTNVLSALQVIGDVTLSASAQQFGGQLK